MKDVKKEVKKQRRTRKEYVYIEEIHLTKEGAK